MPVIDAHQHFWNYDPVEHGWMTDEMSAVKKDFLPGDLQPLLQRNRIDGTVLVQVTQSENETEGLLKIAAENDFIKGVVGWIDLQDSDIYSRLRYYRQYPKLKGFRHILQAEEPDFMLRPEFLNGISALKEFGFTYDILIYPPHLRAAIQLVERCPEQAFVVDHIAKPDIKNNIREAWEEGIRLLALHPNVFCKISGMVTEADWMAWKPGNFTPYMDVAVEAFGINRIMYGSDWPMCLVAASYRDVLKIVIDYFSSFSINEQKLFFGENAVKFYQL